MTITRERFEQGLSYDQYREQMTRNRERFEQNERTVELASEDVAYFRAFERPLHVVVLAEDWCGDVIANLPVLGRLAEASGTLDLRVFLRDQNLDIMDQFLKDGQFRSIPVFAFYDDDFRLIGHWTERPARLRAMMDEMRRSLFASDPALAGLDPATPTGELPEAARAVISQASAAFRAEHRHLSDREVIREIRALLGDSAAISRQPSPTFGDLKRRAAGRTTQHPVKVAITYCAACGYEPQTLELTSALMYEFLHDIASIELVPWQDGAFDVTIDGELVHSMYRDGGFPEPAAIISAVRERLAQS